MIVKHEFLVNFNGRSIWIEGPVSIYDLELFTDPLDVKHS